MICTVVREIGAGTLTRVPVNCSLHIAAQTFSVHSATFVLVMSGWN
jgi:hypothetical protein